MTFLNPTLATIGLLAVAIPILIHILMRRRRQPVLWGAMRFIAEAYRRQRRRMNLEQLLLLAARCGVVLLLALAVGKPLLGTSATGGSQGPKTLYLLIDDSIASGTLENPGQTAASLALSGATAASTLDEEFVGIQQSALSLIAALDAGAGDQVALITVASPVQTPLLPPTSQLAAAAELVKDLRRTASVAAWPAAIATLRSQLASQGKLINATTSVALLSRWRAGSLDRQAPAADAASDESVGWIALAPATAPADNISILAVAPARAVVLASQSAESGGVAVRVSLARSGPWLAKAQTTSFTGVARTVTPPGVVPLQGETATATITWQPGQRTADGYITIPAPPSASAGRGSERTPAVVEVTLDADALAADNRAAATIEVRSRIEAAVIAPAKPLDDAPASAGSYVPADWFSLALAPLADTSLRLRQAGDVRVTLIDPLPGIAPSARAGGAGRNAGILLPFDVIVVTQPASLDAPAWRALREAYDAGAFVLICPHTTDLAHTPASPQLWTDDFIAAMGVSWTFDREATAIDPPLPLVLAPAMMAGGQSASESAARAPRDQALANPLALIAAELPELLRPVTVQRLLGVRASQPRAPGTNLPPGAPTSQGLPPSPAPLDAAAGQDEAGFNVIIQLADGRPFLIAAATPLPSSASTAARGNGANQVVTNASPRGSLIFMAAPLDMQWTDLPARPLTVAMVQELVRSAVGRGSPVLSIVAGESAQGFGPAASDLILLDPVPGQAAAASADSAPRIIPVLRDGRSPPMRYVNILGVRDASSLHIGALAVAPDGRGGDTTLTSRENIVATFLPAGTLPMWLENNGPPATANTAGAATATTAAATSALLTQGQSPPLSLPLLIAAACLALLELCAARFFSHADQRSFAQMGANK